MKLLTLIFILPWPAFGEALEWRDEPKSEMRRVVDRVDELLGGTRTDDSRTSSTLRFRASGESSRFTGAHAEFATRFNLKLGVLQQWQERFNRWLYKDEEKLKRELEPADAASHAAASAG